MQCRSRFVKDFSTEVRHRGRELECNVKGSVDVEAMPAPAPRAIPAPVTPASTASRVSNFPARCEVRMQLICDGRRWRC